MRRVQVLAESDEAGIGDMVAALEADQGLAADLLRYANSAACARPLRARSVRAAVTLVGRKAIAQLAVEATTFRFFARAPGNGGRSIGHLHLHAAAVAALAQSIADRTGAAADVAHLGGLLHDVGKLVMPLAFGAESLDDIAARHLATQGIAGRLGGDEFAVWVPGPHHRGDEAASALLDAVAEAFASGPDVGVSIGAASPTAATDSLATVLSRADEALYEAKRAGRGCAVRA